MASGLPRCISLVPRNNGPGFRPQFLQRDAPPTMLLIVTPQILTTTQRRAIVHGGPGKEDTRMEKICRGGPEMQKIGLAQREAAVGLQDLCRQLAPSWSYNRESREPIR